MIEATLYQRLSAICPDTHPGAVPQHRSDGSAVDYSIPYIVYNRALTDPTRDLEDTDTSAFVTFQVDVYSPRQTEAIALAKLVRTNLKAWKDADVQSVSYSGRVDMIDNTTATQIFRVMQDFIVFANDD